MDLPCRSRVTPARLGTGVLPSDPHGIRISSAASQQVQYDKDRNGNSQGPQKDVTDLAALGFCPVGMHCLHLASPMFEHRQPTRSRTSRCQRWPIADGMARNPRHRWLDHHRHRLEGLRRIRGSVKLLGDWYVFRVAGVLCRIYKRRLRWTHQPVHVAMAS